MSIFVVGINHHTAPISLREKFYFSLDKLALYLQDLVGGGLAREAVLLSTCNRSELYCEADDVTAVRDWFCQQASICCTDEMQLAVYDYQEQAAVRHIMEVACGLDSMVLGEPQILGQMKEAFSESCAANTVSSTFYRLFQQVFALAKEVRTTTAVGACPVSVVSAALHFAKEQCPDFANARILLVGAGDTSALLIRYLAQHQVAIVNRSREKAYELAQSIQAKVYSMSELSCALTEADIVFSATGSATAIITAKTVAEAMPARPDKPLTLIDIAVPRDVEPEVAALDNVRLYCIDDLKVIIEHNRQGREHAAVKAQELIAARSADLIAELNSYDKVGHAIRAYRGQIERLCREELLKTKQQIQQGLDPDLALDLFAHAFVKKLLHVPSVKLRQAGAEGRFELLKFAKQLFAISDTEPERL